MRKIGLLGGSFDPIHEGHIHVALIVYNALNLDEVWFLPTVKTPLKDRGLADIKHRAAMIRMIIKPYRNFKLSMIEEKNTVPSYSINTARLLHRMYPDDKFYWLIGSDVLDQLDHWKDIDELKKLVTFICVQRDEEYRHEDVMMIKGDIHPASSTMVRNGDFTYIPENIRNYIMDNGLYCESIARSTVSEKRWKHVQSVAELCRQFAIGNGADPDKAYRAGLLHDCAKDMDRPTAEAYMRIYHPDKMDLNYNIWHQYVGASYLSRYFKLRDREILRAVEHHCLGDDDSLLSMIVYCADKLDPSRGYDSSSQIELCTRNIKEGFRLVHEEQEAYLRKEGVL
ncbi:MAG: nicotinate (nicotinamide) nucleotide adenylyltransferase [Erysipelotrichaceae bacterium]|nr:nicotinate (nicotinamide) nucleotide adenylyltransferase [Erysipelotrichaceae bacterium]